jgi:Skp family chaperone for outer membrane proteins
MKKLFLAVVVFISAQAMAQSRQGTVEYDKTVVPCYIMDLPFAPGVAEDAIKERFKKMGLPSKEKKGFLEYRNVVIPEISATPIDALIKIDKKSRKEKDASTVYMIVNPIGVTTDATNNSNIVGIAAGTDVFLNSLKGNTEDLSLELEIKKQDDEVKKSEKKYKNLVEDGDDMQKKLKKLQEDIVENTKKQQEQTAEVQKQKEALIQMMGRRRKQG